jgi:hypothetical protein
VLWTKIAALLGVVLLACSAAGQPCQMEWQPGHGIAGVAGPVSAIAAYTPPGAVESLVIIGGEFTHAGGVTVRNIVAWDGQDWIDIAGTIAEFVSSLLIYDGELIAGGRFLIPGHPPTGMAAWNGTTWRTLGDGPPNYVHAMTLWNGGIAVNGPPDPSQPFSPRHVRFWNGFEWHAMSGRLNATSLAAVGGRLFAAGEVFLNQSSILPVPGVAEWDGQEWLVRAELPTIAQVRSLTVFNGGLVAVGNFSSIGATPANNIARFHEGNWYAMGDGISNGRAASVHDGDLYVGARLGGGQDRLAKWDGESWHPVSGVSTGEVRAMCSQGGRLYVGGNFAFVGDRRASNIAVLEHENWVVPGRGFDANVTSMTTWRGDLVAAGWFRETPSGPALFIARQQGNQWLPLLESIDNIITDMVPFRGDLIVSGRFTAIDGVPSSRIARFDGQNWHPLGAGLLEAPAQMQVWNDELMVSIGQAGSGRVLRWDGSVWTVAASMPYFPYIPAGLVVAQDSLYWGLYWPEEGHGITLLVAGQHPLPQHENARPIGRFENGLVVTGYPVNFPGSAPGQRLAQLSGNTWRQFGTFFANPDRWISAVAELNGELIAGGRFTGPSGAGLDNISRWDGAQWVSMGGGLLRLAPSQGEGVRVLHVHDGTLYVGGDFYTAGGLPSAYFARWGCPPAAPCFANCDGSLLAPILNVDDFTCFVNEFAIARGLPHEQQIMHYANCDGSTVEPILNIDDFMCFINQFALGCQ